MIGVHHHEKALVDVALAAGGEELAGRAAQHVAERQRDRIAPILVVASVPAGVIQVMSLTPASETTSPRKKRGREKTRWLRRRWTR